VDVEDAVVMTLAVWAVLGFLAVESVEIYVTLLLIGVLAVTEVAGNFMKPEIKSDLKPTIGFLLLVFSIIVLEKASEVLS